MSVTVKSIALDLPPPAMDCEELYRLGLEASVADDDGRLDLITAHKWFNLAAMLGNAEARTYRAELAREMAADEVAEAQKLAREFLATHRPRMPG
ncbi:MAG: sel1 repeat family protein [Parvularculaceae bacterium]